MIVVALVAWGVNKMITPRTFNRVESTRTMEHDDHAK
jgi:hypothetical protein